MRIVTLFIALFLTAGAFTWLILGEIHVCQDAAKGAEPGKSDNLGRAPDFTADSQWLNSKPITPADRKGKVMLVHFWTNGCINCAHNYGFYNDWQSKYKDEPEFLMIGVHTPEFDSEKDLHRLKERIAKNKLKFAVAVDNEMSNWKAWDNQYWPAIYLVDKSGTIRYRWIGELHEDGFKKVSAQIEQLLSEKN